MFAVVLVDVLTEKTRQRCCVTRQTDGRDTDGHKHEDGRHESWQPRTERRKADMKNHHLELSTSVLPFFVCLFFVSHQTLSFVGDGLLFLFNPKYNH